MVVARVETRVCGGNMAKRRRWFGNRAEHGGSEQGFSATCSWSPNVRVLWEFRAILGINLGPFRGQKSDIMPMEVAGRHVVVEIYRSNPDIIVEEESRLGDERDVGIELDESYAVVLRRCSTIPKGSILCPFHSVLQET